jgi:hypothetical protein
MAIKTYSGAAGVEAGRPSTKIRAEQVHSEDSFTSLAVDLEALRGQVKDIIGAADYKEEITGEYAKVQIVDLAAHLDASGASSLSVKQAANVVGAFSVNTDKFSVAAATGNTLVAGTLGVTGKADFAGIVDVATTLSASEIKIDGDVAQRLYLVGASGQIEDEAKLVFDGSELAVTGDFAAVSGSFSGDVAMGDLGAVNGAFSGNLTVTGDLTINGTTTTINSTVVSIDDKSFVLAQGAAGVALDGAGIYVSSDSAPDAAIAWSNTNSKWTASTKLASPAMQVTGLSSAPLAVDGSGNLAEMDFSSWLLGTANQVSVTPSGTDNHGVTLSLPQSIHTDADVEFDSLKLGDNVADAGKALKIGAAGEVIAAAWNEFVAIESNVGLELVQNGFKAEIGLAQDIRSSATIRFARVELDGADNYVDSSADGLVLRATAAGDSIVFEYDAGKTISLGTAALSGFTATDIMGALNELKAAASAASKKAVYTVAGSAVASGTDIKASLSTDFLAELTGQNSLVFVNGMLMLAGGADYTLAGGALSFTFALQVGDVVVVQKA